jgi:integrase/recombinase XerD
VARVYRQSYKGRDGKMRTLERWYVEAKYAGRMWRIAGFPDRGATKELGRQIDRLASLRGVRQPPDHDLARAVADWPADIRDRVAGIGLLMPSHAAGMRPLAELVETWRASMLDSGVTEHHACQSAGRVERLLATTGCAVWSDLEPLRIERALAAARRDKPSKVEGEPSKPGLSTAASNAWLAAVRGFCRWAVRNGMAVEDPLRSLRPLKRDRSDDRVKRRALEPEDLRKLLAAAAGGPEIQGVPGPTRALVYRLAATSGLRAGEIRSLRVGSFDLESDTPTVTVQAAYSKRRRDDVQPIPQETAEALAPFLRGRMPSASAFNLPASWRSAEAVYVDLKAAGIPDKDAEGRVADFHALRHGYISALAGAGVSPKVAQTLARHSTITLTLDRYTHLRTTDERNAVQRLPSLGAASAMASIRATGTDGDMASCASERLARSRTEPHSREGATPSDGPAKAGSGVGDPPAGDPERNHNPRVGGSNPSTATTAGLVRRSLPLLRRALGRASRCRAPRAPAQVPRLRSTAPRSEPRVGRLARPAVGGTRLRAGERRAPGRSVGPPAFFCLQKRGCARKRTTGPGPAVPVEGWVRAASGSPEPPGRTRTAPDPPSTDDTMEANDLQSDEPLDLEPASAPLEGDYDFDEDVADDDFEDDDDDDEDDDVDVDDDEEDDDDDDDEDDLLGGDDDE